MEKRGNMNMFVVLLSLLFLATLIVFYFSLQEKEEFSLNQLLFYPNSIFKDKPTFNKKEWGAYVGWQANDLKNFEQKVGKQVNLQATFVHWGNENRFPIALAQELKVKGKTLVIFWEASDYNVQSNNQPRFNADSINRGEWDRYIESFANEAKAYGGPLILIPFEELNGNWSPWSGTLNNNSPEKIKQAYRRIRNLFRNTPNVKFGWTVNSVSVPDTKANAIENYYPGDQYVDYVGIDGFNFGQPWLNFNQIFRSGLDKLKVYKKPIYIFSMACAEDKRKAAWIKDALTVQIPKHQEIKGWIWFNENKEKDWRVDSSAGSLEAFKSSLPR